MANTSAMNQPSVSIQAPASSKLVAHKPSPWFNLLAIVVVITGIIYAGYHLADDLSVVQDTRAYPYILLGIALVIALGFEFVNGFHDTANAVATVIYTNSMSPNLAVIAPPSSFRRGSRSPSRLGTMIGWKRIVVTVGERIGKTHMTYAQGASAEIVAMATIGAAELYGLPVSTTHVLSSGVAGTMVANHSGLQWATVRNLLMAWVLTLPVSVALSGGLYWLLRTVL